MTNFDDDSEDFLKERDILMAYMMTFAIKSYQIIQKQDSDALWSLCTRSAEEIYAYRNGKMLPADPGTAHKPKKRGWKVF